MRNFNLKIHWFIRPPYFITQAHTHIHLFLFLFLFEWNDLLIEKTISFIGQI